MGTVWLLFGCDSRHKTAAAITPKGQYIRERRASKRPAVGVLDKTRMVGQRSGVGEKKVDTFIKPGSDWQGTAICDRDII